MTWFYPGLSGTGPVDPIGRLWENKDTNLVVGTGARVLDDWDGKEFYLLAMNGSQFKKLKGLAKDWHLQKMLTGPEIQGLIEAKLIRGPINSSTVLQDLFLAEKYAPKNVKDNGVGISHEAIKINLIGDGFYYIMKNNFDLKDKTKMLFAIGFISFAFFDF